LQPGQRGVFLSFVGGKAMPDFRVYPLGADGHFASPEEHSAASDEVVLNYAAGKDFPYGAEIWEGARLVGLIQKSALP
jgi:hypothetical protein